MIKKLADYQYERVDFDAFKLAFDQNLSAFNTASTVAEAKTALDALIEQQALFDSQFNLYSIRFSLNMDDPFYKAEDDYWNEAGPKFAELDNQFNKALTNSPLKAELQAFYPATFFKLAEQAVKTFDESIIELAQAENKLSTQYNELIGSAQIPFNGETLTLPQINKFVSDADRTVRQAASSAVTNWYTKHEATFDAIYDQMVQNRHAQALALGYKDYVELSYDRRQRIGYDRTDVETYRAQVLKYVVPVATKFYQRQQTRLGYDTMHYYDWPLEFLDGNPKPKGSTAEKVALGQQMYRELSPETGEFFDFMVEHDLLNLDSHKGKQSGGYATVILNELSPFIFANYNGTSGDVDVLTHEAGHAFQAYESMKSIKAPTIVWPTIEAAEIFSMSMEFIAWPWMEQFFGDATAKYKYAHLLHALQFLPYGVLVDHFQQVVYENPTMTPAKRKATWRELEQMYLPHKQYGEDAPLLERGGFWYRQGHIFDVPFYYIDYTLAQVVAFQFWQRFEIEGDKAAAWADYLTAAKAGGTQSFLEIIEQTHLQNPLVAGALQDSIAKIDAYLSNIAEVDL
ncbi:MAG: M3 family oligoendopeptidase [Lactobacillaceae bacterium]|jgi:M3 family oligoendopeptidase|nr:M3 family oligoendopeptidase [Lactobacillaceae bacterium]